MFKVTQTSGWPVCLKFVLKPVNEKVSKVSGVLALHIFIMMIGTHFE
jgi:hypothetical protein